MNYGRKISSKYILALIFTALFFSVTFNSPANYSKPSRFVNSFIPAGDTVRPGHAPLPDRADPGLLHRDSVTWPPPSIADTIRKVIISRNARLTDSLARAARDTFPFKISKDTLDAPVDYKASDSAVMDIPGKKVTLYNEANTKYKDLDLTAYKLQFDQNRNVIVASHTTDTAGKVVGLPVMVTSDNKMKSDSIVYSMKSQKGITNDTYTQSGDMFIHGEKIKKISKNEYFAYRGTFTTCNLDTPHFAFRANKMKLINKEFAITGPIHPEFEGVPIPIYLPFGIFPISQGRHSGLLPPQFTTSDQYGIGLEGLGYYKVLSDNFDVTMTTNIYSYGGWTVFFKPEYRVRYRYSGQLNFTLQNTKILNTTGTEAYTTSKTFSLSWSHVVDSKAHPGQNFSANVNIASTKYNQFVLNNPVLNYQNQLNSSITYSKTWDGKYNLTVSGNHNQNNQTRLINVSLPNLTFSAPTIYPLAKKDFVGQPKWYEKLGIGLNTTVSGNASFYDSLFTPKNVLDTFQWGAQNTIPISLSLPQVGPFQIAPGVSFQNRIYSRRMYRVWDAANNKVDTIGIQKGVFYGNDMSFSLSLSTAIFGTFQHFGKNSSIAGLRHVIRPTISLSYKPNLSGGDHYWLQTDSTGYKQRVSYYDGSTYGAFTEGRFGGINFGLDNHIEMKLRSKKDTGDAAIKKITLIDGFGFTGSYNYLADSMKLSPISFYFRSTLFEKINITGGASLDPYKIDSFGRDTKYYAWQNKFALGRITSGNLAISTSFKSKPKDEKLAKEQENANSDQIPMTPEEQQAQMNYVNTHSAQFANFNVPWSINLSFSLNYSRVAEANYTFLTTLTESLNWSGDFNLTPKWKIGMNTYYDVKYEKINSLTMSISRDLHCWQMAINVTPVGINHSFNITISPKAGLLQDLKITRAKYFYDQ